MIKFEFEADLLNQEPEGWCEKLEVTVTPKDGEISDLSLFSLDSKMPVQFSQISLKEMIKIIDLARYHIDMNSQKESRDEDYYFDVARELALTNDETQS